VPVVVLPKGAVLSVYAQEQLDAIAEGFERTSEGVVRLQSTVKAYNDPCTYGHR